MTRLIDAGRMVDLAEGLISAKKQRGDFTLDLTVRDVAKIESGGALDFGGSEFRAASAHSCVPEKKSPEEPYGWWNLGPGTYLIAFNETLAADGQGLIVIFPHNRLLAAGGWHPSAVVPTLDREIRVPLEVGAHGLAIKQNARVSRAIMLAEVSP